MGEYKVHDCAGQTENCYGKRGATAAQIQSQPRTRKQDRELHKSPYLKLNRVDSDNRRSKNSRPHRKRVPSPRPGVGAGSMASAENELETSNTSMSEGQEPPTANDAALEQNKVSLNEPFPSRYDVDDNPTTPNLPAQPTTTRPISNEDSGVATPNPMHPGGRDRRSSGVSRLPQPTADQHAPSPILEHSTVTTRPLYSASNPERTSQAGGAVGEIVGEARPTSSDIPAAEILANEDYEIITLEDSNTSDADCNSSLDLDWLCTQDRNESEYMTLIPYSLSSVEPLKVFIKPPKAELQRVAEQRLDVRHRRHEIQNLKNILDAKEKQILKENEETFKRLREFVTEPHKRSKIHDSRLELAWTLFFASRLSRDECGPLIDEISSLQERLAFEEIKLTDAEDSLYESFGIPSMESEEGQENGIAKSGLPISHSQSISESEHTTHIHNAEGEDGGLDYDAYSTGSFEKYRINYHPLYIKYERQRGTQDNLYERHAHLLSDLVRLEDQQENRRRVGLTLLKDDQDFLDSLPEIIRLLDYELTQSDHEIERLKSQCLEQGIIDEDDNYIGDDGEVSSGSDDSTPPPPPPPLPPPQITITPNPASSLPITDRSVIASNPGIRLDDQLYQNRINPWLLGKLAASRTELALLATILSAMDAEPDVASLLDVLKLWDHDGAGMEPPQRPGKLDEATVDKLRRVTRGVLGDGFDRALVSSLFGLSLWGGEAYGGSDETAYLDDIVSDGS